MLQLLVEIISCRLGIWDIHAPIANTIRPFIFPSALLEGVNNLSDISIFVLNVMCVCVDFTISVLELVRI